MGNGQSLESELELCPFLKKCEQNQDQDDSILEDYCVINYEECPFYIARRIKENEKDVKLYGI